MSGKPAAPSAVVQDGAPAPAYVILIPNQFAAANQSVPISSSRIDFNLQLGA
jgi:hypothetical protein